MTKEFDARNENKSRSVCAAMAEAADTGKRVLTERERAILDMWPRFEDGEPVWFGDGAAVNVGNIAIEAIEFTDGCAYVKDGACGDYNTLVQVFKHVKRPAPEVLDADGVPIKVGDTVWDDSGVEMTVMSLVGELPGHVTTHSKIPPARHSISAKLITHTRPDSWEQLEEDAREFARDNQLPHDVDQMERDAVDLIRRAKKLAGVE